MQNSNLSRKGFLKNSALGVAGMTIGSGFLSTAAAAAETNPGISMTKDKPYLLKKCKIRNWF